ncbi:hypothetical protein PGT21_028353 [Puccinia graminis f. sp. tritici]|uniref:Uncharacterized protein n=1 Tax=Puccinia graminis f. sp. tritici TaxID=56615 RepID=A0A5B0NX14_PUCGR|nr:hypothetical protein PGT21_028353 [Puccinia graminis f. sp. tritici]
MRLGPRPAHTTQPWVVWVGLAPKRIYIYAFRPQANPYDPTLGRMAELDPIPSFPTLNHHLTDGTQRPTTDRPPNPKSTRTAATGIPETRSKQETPRTPDSPLIRSDPIRWGLSSNLDRSSIKVKTLSDVPQADPYDPGLGRMGWPGA